MGQRSWQILCEGWPTDDECTYKERRSLYMSPEKYKLKQWDVSIYLLENGPNPGKWQHQMLVRMCGNRNTHAMLLGFQYGPATLADYLAFSYKVKHTLPCNPAVLLLGIYCKGF